MLKLLFTGTCISSENIMLSIFFYFQTIWKSSFIYLFLGVLPVSIKKYGAVIFRLFFTFFLIGIKNITKKREYLLFVLPFFLKTQHIEGHDVKFKILETASLPIKLIWEGKSSCASKCTLYTQILIHDVSFKSPFFG